MRPAPWLVALLLAVAFVPLAEAANHTVCANDNFWSPSSKTVASGDMVTFTKCGSNNHTFDALWSGGTDCNLPCAKTFTNPGTYNYRCGVHPTTMTGSITVPTPPPPPPPSVAISAPAAGATLSGTATVTGTATAAAGTISKVEVRVDNGAYAEATLLGSGASVSWTYDLPTGGHADGARQIKARASATNGGVSADVARAVTFANAPTPAISSPAPGAAVSGSFLVTGTAVSPALDVGKVEVQLAGGAFRLATLHTTGTSVDWSVTVDAVGLANGPAPLVARATAAGPVGQARTTSISVDVQNPPAVDLRAVSVSGSTTGATASNIQYKIRNDGNVPSGPFQAKLEYRYKGTWFTAGTFSDAGIPALTEVTRTASWSNPGLTLVGRFDVRLVADSAGAIAETNEDNNVVAGVAGFVSGSVPGIDLRNP